jgi:hypothetical protein
MLSLRIRLVAVRERGIRKPATNDHHLIGVHDIRTASAMPELIGLRTPKGISFNPFEGWEGENVNVVKCSRTAKPITAVEVAVMSC